LGQVSIVFALDTRTEGWIKKKGKIGRSLMRCRRGGKHSGEGPLKSKGGGGGGKNFLWRIGVGKGAIGGGGPKRLLDHKKWQSCLIDRLKGGKRKEGGLFSKVTGK